MPECCSKHLHIGTARMKVLLKRQMLVNGKAEIWKKVKLKQINNDV